jgi:hypothetical protein
MIPKTAQAADPEEPERPEKKDGETAATWVEREVRDDRNLALTLRMRQGAILDRFIDDPRALASALENIDRSLSTLKTAGIKRTTPGDWILFKDRDGARQTALLSGPGALRVAQLFRISFGRYRNSAGDAIEEPEILAEDDGSYSAEIIADAYSALTGQYVQGVVGRRNSQEDFVGRKTHRTQEVPRAVSRNDVRSSAFTAMISKAVRVLGALASVPIEALQAAGLDTSKCRLGHGFKRDDRAAQGAQAEAGAAGAAGAEGRISEPQARRLWALAYSRVKTGDKPLDDEQKDRASRHLNKILRGHGFNETKEVTPIFYEAVADAVQKNALPGEED